MINLCKEGVSPELVFFALSCCWFYCYGLSKHKFCMCEGQLMKILGFIFSSDQEKNHVGLFNAGILRLQHKKP